MQHSSASSSLWKNLLLQYILLADFKQKMGMVYTTRYAKQTSWNTFAYAYENVNMLHHFSFEYHVDFFPPWMLLYQISVLFFFSPNDSTVQANFILYCIMTYCKTARGKSKWKKTTSNHRINLYRFFSFGDSTADLRDWQGPEAIHQHTQPPKNLTSFMQHAIFSTS